MFGNPAPYNCLGQKGNCRLTVVFWEQVIKCFNFDLPIKNAFRFFTLNYFNSEALWVISTFWSYAIPANKFCLAILDSKVHRYWLIHTQRPLNSCIAWELTLVLCYTYYRYSGGKIKVTVGLVASHSTSRENSSWFLMIMVVAVWVWILLSS